MANLVDASVMGADDIDHMLSELPKQMRDTILPKAMNACAAIVRVDAMRRINSDRDGRKPPGLARTIVVKVKKYENTVVAVVGPLYLGVNHAHLVEFGHRLVRKIKNADGTISKVEIGFVRPKPFLRPAADETIRQQRNVIESIVRKALAEMTA